MPSTTDQKIEVSLPISLQHLYWGALAVGALLILLGFGGKEYGYLIAACFLGIVSRILQAEHHHGSAARKSSGD